MFLPSEEKVWRKINRLTHNSKSARYSIVDDAEGNRNTVLRSQNLKQNKMVKQYKCWQSQGQGHVKKWPTVVSSLTQSRPHKMTLSAPVDALFWAV